MSDPSRQYSFDLKLPQLPVSPVSTPNYEDVVRLYNAVQALAYQVELILQRLAAAAIP